MTEANVEGLAVLVDHNVVRVSVANAQSEGCRTVACAGGGDCVNGLVHLVCVLVLDSLVQLGTVQLQCRNLSSLFSIWWIVVAFNHHLNQSMMVITCRMSMSCLK